MLPASLLGPLLALAAAAPATKAPALPRGATGPGEVEFGCAQRGLRLPPDVLVTTSGTVRVKVWVSAAGKLERIEVPEGVPETIAEAFTEAVQRCPFRPGRDAAGAALAGSTQVAFRFVKDEVAATKKPPAPLAAGPGRSGPPAERPDLKRRAREADHRCLERAPGAAGAGDVVLELTVSSTGEATGVDLRPSDLSPAVRKAILDRVQACRWLPAQATDGTPVADRIGYFLTYR